MQHPPLPCRGTTGMAARPRNHSEDTPGSSWKTHPILRALRVAVRSQWPNDLSQVNVLWMNSCSFLRPTCTACSWSCGFTFITTSPALKVRHLQMVSCLASKPRLSLSGETEVAVSPSAIQIARGAAQQFSATVIGETDLPVTWKVSGVGCSELTCGSISSTGLYTSPSDIPSPPTLTVTSTLPTPPGKSALARVSIVDSPSSR